MQILQNSNGENFNNSMYSAQRFVRLLRRGGGGGSGEGGSIGTRGMFVRDQSTRNRYQISSTENSTLRGLFFSTFDMFSMFLQDLRRIDLFEDVL